LISAAHGTRDTLRGFFILKFAEDDSLTVVMKICNLSAWSHDEIDDIGTAPHQDLGLYSNGIAPLSMASSSF
jgi:hypothetical protein